MKLNINKLKLKWKVFAFIFGFCALLLLILWLFQVVFLELFYQRIKIAEIKNDANIIENNLDNENLSDLIESISDSGDLYIELSSLDGNNILCSSDTRYKLPLVNKLNMISSAKSNKNEFYKRITSDPPEKPEEPKGISEDLSPSNVQQSESLAYIKLVENSNGETFAIIINAIISPVNATVNTLRYQLYFVSGIMIIFSILLALIISRRISKPIEEINKSAKVLAAGSYDVYFDGKGFLEIKELSDTLNKTAIELNKVEVLRHELLANISHDLRTPLSLIYSYAEMINDFPDEVTSEQTQIIMDETQRLKTLVNDLLDISKLESGMQELNLSKYNFTMSVKGTTERMAELVKKNGYSILFRNDEDVYICADETRITQVVYNLLINALNYTGEDKRILIRQITSDDKVRLEVVDTGDGIDPENLPYIWERYYKVSKKHKRAVMGTGLGLSIVKKIINLHGGSYGVKSEVGKGSVFWFEIKKDNIP